MLNTDRVTERPKNRFQTNYQKNTQMRLTILFTAIIGISANVWAQSTDPKETRAADKAFNEFSYLKAARIYASYLPSKDSAYILQRLSSSYLQLNQRDSAESYLQRTVRIDGVDPQYYFHYAEALASEQKYEEADKWYRRYDEVAADKNKVQDKILAIENINEFFLDSANFTLASLDLNSQGLDFSPTLYKGGIVFASSRPNRKLSGRKKFNWDRSPFLDLYYGSSTEDAVYFSENLNTDYHEGPLEFYNSEQNIVMTRNNYEGGKLGRDDEGIARLKLFFTEFDEETNDWGEAVPFQYNSNDYSNGHPTITEDGQVLIYSSDMPGGFGQSDLYISLREGNGWGQPQNLGAHVNSDGRESFPFLIEDRLFFATDGRGGLGGLDIFEIAVNEKFEPIGNPENIGYPLNSSKDDFGLVTQDGFEDGYFTSAREGARKDDIYYFRRSEPAFYGEVYDLATNQPIPKADVFMVDSIGGKEFYARSGGDGVFEIPNIDNLTIMAGKSTYSLVKSVSASLDEMKGNKRIRVYLQQAEPEGPVEVAETVSVITKEDSLLIAPIYYDFDKHDLRVLSENQLDRVLFFLNKYPDVKIELSSHTDARGEDAYNQDLSQRRAKEANQYLIEKGIAPSRITPVGYGETKLVNNCGDDQSCGKEQHQLNRRTEFKILSRG